MFTNNEKYTLERESDVPENWVTNMIYRKNSNGNIEMIEVKDDSDTDNAKEGEQ